MLLKLDMVDEDDISRCEKQFQLLDRDHDGDLDVADLNALADAPCGVCPVFRDCHPGGLISPETCTYFNEWMQF